MQNPSYEDVTSGVTGHVAEEYHQMIPDFD